MKKKTGAIALIGLLGALALVLGILENPAPAAGHAARRKSRAFKPCHHVRRQLYQPARGAVYGDQGSVCVARRAGVSAGLMNLRRATLSTLIMGILWQKQFTPVFIPVSAVHSNSTSHNCSSHYG